MVVYFELVSDLQLVHRRDFPVYDTTILDPNGTNPLIDGEFMTLNDSYQLVRASSAGIGWPVFAERGRFDVQALKKTTVLFGNSYEADTKVMLATSITTGCKLELSASLTITGVTGNKCGLVVYSAGTVIGYCTRIPNNNGSRLRFIQTLF